MQKRKIRNRDCNTLSHINLKLTNIGQHSVVFQIQTYPNAIEWASIWGGERGRMKIKRIEKEGSLRDRR